MYVFIVYVFFRIVNEKSVIMPSGDSRDDDELTDACAGNKMNGVSGIMSKRGTR